LRSQNISEISRRILTRKTALILGVLFFVLFAVPVYAHAFLGTLIGAVAGAALFAAGGGLASISIGVFGTTVLTVTSLAGFVALGSAAGTALGYISKALAPDVPDVGYSSPTYSQTHPVLTVQEGTPVAEAYGLGPMAGNVIRQNDPDATSYIKLMVAHCKGEVDSFLAQYVNDVEWNTLQASHAKWEHEGAENQSGLTNLWNDSESCDFRGLAITEYKLVKGNEINQVSNAYAIGRLKKCLEIGQNSGGTESWTRNQAQIMWDGYVKKEGESTSTLDENAFTALETYLDTLITDDLYSAVGAIISGDRIKATGSTGYIYAAKHAFDLALPLTGTWEKAAWVVTATSNQTVNIDLGDAYAINKIIIDNGHSSGGSTTAGINNFSIQGSNTAAALDNTTYSSDTNWTNVATGLSASEHSGSDAADPEEITFSNGTAYRYYRFKITDNHGHGTYMSIRRIKLYHTGGKRSTFDYVFDTNIQWNDAKKIIWNSFNGKCIQSQGKIKPVWDAAEEHDGAGGLQAKAVAHAFTTDNIVKGSLSWKRLEHPNVYIVHFRDKANAYKKTMIQMRDARDIAQRGEITFSETCWWITERSLAKRRCKFLYNKGRYPDFQCRLTGLPETQLLEIYDRVTVTHSLPGWSAKGFIIIDKDEDQYGRPVFVMEAYLSAVYDDYGAEEQPGYQSFLPNPNQPPPPIDATTITTTFNAGSTEKWAMGTVTITFTPPEYMYYSHTDIYISTDDVTYYYVGSDADGTYIINGMGRYYQPGDTIYIKLQNYNQNGVAEPLPSAYLDSITISGALKLASFYAGLYDFWGGHEEIGNAATTIVLGGLSDTPKIALGASANSLQKDNMATHPGFYADGDGNFRAGGSSHGIKYDVDTGILEVDPKLRVGLASGAYIDIDGENNRIVSSDYVTGYFGGGFLVSPGLFEVGNALVRGMIRTSVFQYDAISTVGGNLLVRPGDVLAEDMTSDS
jgi:hypothetical protein